MLRNFEGIDGRGMRGLAVEREGGDNRLGDIKQAVEKLKAFRG
jgi:hypothetical protein